MSLTDLLSQTCIVKRHSINEYDDYGRPIWGWTNYLTDVACRLNAAGGREVKIGAEVVIVDFRLYVEDIDVTEQDIIVLDSHAYGILLVEPFRNGDGLHHKRLQLRMVREVSAPEISWPAGGTEFPDDAHEGEVFYRRDLDELYVYTVT